MLPEAAVCVEELRLGAEQLETELREALVLLRPRELDPGALRSRDPRLDERRQCAEVREAQALEIDPLPCDAVADEGGRLAPAFDRALA